MKRLLLILLLLALFAKPAAAYSIGFVGCSNSWMTVQGYHWATGNLNKFWPRYSTGGGTINMWASPTSIYWSYYRQMIASYGQPQKVWVQLCEKDSSATPTATYAMVQTMLANLKAISPAAIVYVSPINLYDPNPGLCSYMGTAGEGVTDTVAWAQQAVADGLALAGPTLGPLTASLVQADGCHPTNPTGATFLGTQLENFFDPIP